jgi:hypothetical protein
MNFKKTVITTAVMAAMGASMGVANAAQISVGTAFTTSFNNFTMLSGTGEPSTIPSSDGIGIGAGNAFGGGASNLTVSWDGSVYNASGDYGLAANMTITNAEAFFGHVWTASNVQVFAPGSYTMGGNTATVGAGELMAHMHFSWNTATGINVFQLWKTDAAACFGDCTTQLWTGGANPGGNTFGTTFAWSSIDTVMPDGPFAGSNANFNIQGSAVNLPAPAVVPIPAAAWLFGSGLMGLAAVARRKKKA